MKLNLNSFLPKPKEDDILFNRRILAYYGLLFTVYWSHLVLVCYIVLALAGVGSDAALVALLGVPSTLAGMGFWKYLKAAEKDDADKGKNNSSTNNGLTNGGDDVEDREP